MLTIIALVAAALFVPSPWGVWLVVGAVCIDLAETAVMVTWSRRRRASGPPAVGTEAIIGRTGVTLSRLDADRHGVRGQVRVDGEIWRARAIEPVDAGVTVVVRSVEGLVLEVEPPARPC